LSSIAIIAIKQSIILLIVMPVERRFLYILAAWIWELKLIWALGNLRKVSFTSSKIFSSLKPESTSDAMVKMMGTGNLFHLPGNGPGNTYLCTTLLPGMLWKALERTWKCGHWSLVISH
jgi:hypothetical protein